MKRNRETLSPLFSALPKDSTSPDRLDVRTFRYFLHRYYSAFHGLTIKGFEPALYDAEELPRMPKPNSTTAQDVAAVLAYGTTLPTAILVFVPTSATGDCKFVRCLEGEGGEALRFARKVRTIRFTAVVLSKLPGTCTFWGFQGAVPKVFFVAP